jgi:hypothetical protein
MCLVVAILACYGGGSSAAIVAAQESGVGEMRVVAAKLHPVLLCCCVW